MYKDNPYAVPNLYTDEFAEFDPKKNDAFRFAECKMFLAYKDGKIAGRIAGIWHRGANEKFGLKQLRFTRFDVIDDFEVTKALFAELFKWAKELGMEEIIGPISFSDLNEEGMLIDGFDKDSTYIEIYNHPYYVEHMERLGAYKVVDWHCLRIAVPEKDERLERLANAIAKRNGYTVLDVKWYLRHNKKKLSEYIMQCLDVLRSVRAAGSSARACRRYFKGRQGYCLRLYDAFHQRSVAKRPRKRVPARNYPIYKGDDARGSGGYDEYRHNQRA